MCYTLILMFWWLGAHFLYKILQIQNFIRPDPVKKPAKPEKLKFMNTQHVTYHFSYFFMESSFLMSDLSNLDLFFKKMVKKNILEDISKYFLKISHNHKIIMKYNKIEWFWIHINEKKTIHYKKNSIIFLT